MDFGTCIDYSKRKQTYKTTKSTKRSIELLEITHRYLWTIFHSICKWSTVPSRRYYHICRSLHKRRTFSLFYDIRISCHCYLSRRCYIRTVKNEKSYIWWCMYERWKLFTMLSVTLRKCRKLKRNRCTNNNRCF